MPVDCYCAVSVPGDWGHCGQQSPVGHGRMPRASGNEEASKKLQRSSSSYNFRVHVCCLLLCLFQSLGTADVADNEACQTWERARASGNQLFEQGKFEKLRRTPSHTFPLHVCCLLLCSFSTGDGGCCGQRSLSDTGSMPEHQGTSCLRKKSSKNLRRSSPRGIGASSAVTRTLTSAAVRRTSSLPGRFLQRTK